MNGMATISSKRQLTIPAKIFKRLNLSQKQRVIVSEEDGVIKITPAIKLLNELGGSVKVPKRFKGMAIDEMIKKAKEEYFKEKYSKKYAVR